MASLPRRIALVSTEMDFYGGEQQATLLANGLRAGGHDCVVIGRKAGKLVSVMQERGFATHELPGSGSGPAALLALRRVLNKYGADVVHANDSRAMTTVGLALPWASGAVRVASRRVAFRPRSPWAYRRWCDRVVCVSETVRHCCLEAGIPARLLRVVPDGVDPARVAAGDRARGRATLGLADNDIAVLSVASLTPCKGHTVLIEAFAQLRHRHPKARLFLAGAGDLRGALEDQVQRLDLQACVHLLGYRDDVPDLLHAADVVTLASTEEGLGSSLIDAMLAQRPIAATAAGGIAELLGDDGDGPVAWLAPASEPSRLADALQQALTESEAAIQRCQRAFARAMDRYVADKMVASTIAVYEEALDMP